MASVQKLPIGIQSFEKLRTDNFVYVDKTAFVYDLAKDSLPYFLGRPRRFGKSLFLSTLKAYFQGKKELFEGLAITKLEKDWIEYPVFHMDFVQGSCLDINSLYAVLDTNLREIEKKWGENPKETNPAARLKGLILRAHEKTGRKVVVLIDEYDKPLLGTMDDLNANDEIRTVLKGFYSVLKSADEYLRFVFLTGVTKFSKVSIFSDLNQLRDISMREQYSEICGISEKELIEYFQPSIEALAEKTGKTCNETLAELKKRYDGYHFSKNSAGMYNPFSLLNAFADLDYNNYWFSTGTPTFLTKMLRDGQFHIPNLENDIRVLPDEIVNYRIEGTNPIPILYQSGYLTIKDYDKMTGEYTLGFPNEEVKYGFFHELLITFAPVFYNDQSFSVGRFVTALHKGDIEDFMINLQAFYASISYELAQKKMKEDEKYYQFIFYMLFSLMGQLVETEVRTATGRADAVVKLADAIYVFEFKMTGKATAKAALKQIDDKDYAIPYIADGRKIVKIGVEFNSRKRGISNWMIA